MGSCACECAARDARGVACLIQEEDSADRLFDHLCCFTGRAVDIAVDECGARVVVLLDGIFPHNADLIEHLGHNLRHRGLARARIAEK